MYTYTRVLNVDCKGKDGRGNTIPNDTCFLYLAWLSVSDS